MSGLAQGDACSGSFGANVFTTGDFGRGTQNIPPTDPGYAPGFTYSTSTPFGDGRYTITNNMGAWPNNYGTWLGISDNSNDPLGYMMVVNAAYEPGIFYEQTVEDLCAGLLYQVSFDVINVIRTEVTNHGLPNVSLLLNDEEVLTTGPIPQDEEWHSFTLTLTAETEDLKVTLRNNAPGGIGNDLAIDNISFRPCGPVARIINDDPGKICENALFPTLHVDIDEEVPGAAVQWQISFDGGSMWENIPGANALSHTVEQLTAGTYHFRYLWAVSADNITKPLCRVRSDVTLVEVVPVEFLIVDTLCAGLAFDLGGILYDETGVYMEQLVSSIGCDSIVTLDLTIKPDPGLVIDAGARPPSCTGYPDAAIWVDQVLQGDAPYTIHVEGYSAMSVADTLLVPAGSYMLAAEDRHGCRTDQPIETGEAPIFTITGLVDTQVVVGHELELAPVISLPVASVTWSGENIACPTCPSTVVRPFQSGSYEIVAYNNNGCEARAELSMTVTDDFDTYYPNVFSPNEDGVNDDWGIALDQASILRIEQLVILDRWGGVMLLEQDLPVEGAWRMWDGTRKGSKALPGVYTFSVILEVVNGDRIYKTGTITLVR